MNPEFVISIDFPSDPDRQTAGYRTTQDSPMRQRIMDSIRYHLRRGCDISMHAVDRDYVPLYERFRAERWT